MDYEKDIIIDEEALDFECLEQPRLMLKYTRIEAESIKELDLASENLSLVRAELDKAIRLDPEKFGIEKVTETAITNVILSNEEYQKANKSLIEAKFDSKVAQGAVRAFDQRKSMLETLTRLHGQQYFAGPKVPRDLSKEAELKRLKQKEINKGIARAIRTK